MSKNKSKNNLEINDNKFNDSIDIREKRIGIVFKVIYVIAALFVTSITAIAKEQGNDLNKNYIILSFASTFLLCLLYKMVIYIFNELKCLKLNDDIAKKQIIKTENSYMDIFNYFTVGGSTAFFACLISFLSYDHFTQKGLAIVSVVFVALSSIVQNITIINESDLNKKIQQSICSILWTIAISTMILMSNC